MGNDFMEDLFNLQRCNGEHCKWCAYNKSDSLCDNVKSGDRKISVCVDGLRKFDEREEEIKNIPTEEQCAEIEAQLKGNALRARSPWDKVVAEYCLSFLGQYRKCIELCKVFKIPILELSMKTLMSSAEEQIDKMDADDQTRISAMTRACAILINISRSIISQENAKAMPK